jgi:hypothetical protein
MAEDRMPNLTRDAVAARKMGKSYGQYIAWKEEQELRGRLSEDKKYKQGPLCAICGKPISKAGRNRKYCGAECADRARLKHQHKYDKTKTTEE